MKKNDEPEMLVSFADLWQLCKDSKKKIFSWALLFAVLAGFYALSQPIEYEARATFRERARTQSGTSSNSLSALLMQNNHGSSSEAISLLKSKRILERVAREKGLQASLHKKEMRFETLAKIRNNIAVEYATLRGKPRWVMPSNAIEIKAEGVAYEGEIPLSFHIQFISENSFQYSHKAYDAGIGEIGTPIILKEIRFTIMRQSDQPLTFKEYTLTLEPLYSVVQGLLNGMKIETDRDDKTLIKLRYAHSNRHLAADILNSLMHEYKKFLIEEQQHLLHEQVNYLQTRQDKMQVHLHKMMEEYAVKLTSDLSNFGFPDSNKAIDFLASRQSENAKELLALDLDLKRLQKHEHSQSSDIAFQGLNLETAQELSIHYSKQLNALESDILQRDHLSHQLQEPEFEISSLSTILEDPVSNEMVSKASALLLSLRDQRNRSAKDQERLKSELAVQKGFLTEHIKQTIQLLQLREKLLKEKIQTLLNMSLGLIKQEREVIEQHQQELQKEIAKLPNKWVSERLIDQQMETNKRMVEEITKLVESKNINSNLELIQSAPVDSASPPLKPRPPRILLFMILGAFAGSICALGISLTQAIRGGIKTTEGNLKTALQQVLGTLSKQYKSGSTQPYTDQDLSLFRRIALFIESTIGIQEPWMPRVKSSALIVLGNSPDYSLEIAALLGVKGWKVLLLPLSFDKTPSPGEQEGLLPYLEGKISAPAIQKMQGYDKIPPGGACRFASEYLGSLRFAKLFDELQQSYDWIIGVTHAQPNSAEVEQLMKQFHCAVITVTDQKFHELQSCMAAKNTAFVLVDI